MSKAHERDYEEFPTTHWSLVDRAARNGPAASPAALGQLLQRYLPALRAHLLQARHLAPEHVDDLLQGFVTRKFLEENLAAQADRTRGKFRTFVLTVLDRYVVSELRRGAAQKRGAARCASMSPQALDAKAVDDRQPADAYSVAWARQVLSQAVAYMGAECRSSGRPALWDLFEARILKPALEGSPPPEYGQLVERLGFRSPSQASNALITAKRMFERNLRAVVAEYAGDPTEVDEEIRELWGILSRPGAGSC